MSVGRFDTITKTKITTPYGIILKVTRYEEDSNLDVEYKVRPVCVHCHQPLDCFCFNDDNSDFPYEDALYNLKMSWVCERYECLSKYMLEFDPELFGVLCTRHKGDKLKISDSIYDQLGVVGAGDFCGV